MYTCVYFFDFFLGGDGGSMEIICREGTTSLMSWWGRSESGDALFGVLSIPMVATQLKMVVAFCPLCFGKLSSLVLGIPHIQFSGPEGFAASVGSRTAAEIARSPPEVARLGLP